MCGILNAQEGDYLLWNIERTITKIYIPVLLDSCMSDKGTKDLLTKVRGRALGMSDKSMNKSLCKSVK